MKLFGLRGKDVDEGACLHWKCPQCEEERRYHLIMGRVELTLGGIGAMDTENLVCDLRCVTCKYDLRVPPAELPLVEQCRALTQQLLAGQLTQEAYVPKIKEVPARFIKDLLALTEEWKCPACGEENPVTFDACWSCQSKQIKGPILLTEDIKPLPGFKTHTNPWDV